MTPLSHRIAKLAPAVLLIALVLPSSAFGQATRTWVSGVGDDVNPCSRTAPCKTWAGAYSKTAVGGEINALDPGGFGTLTIGKSITIDGEETQSGVLAGGVNGFTINAGPTDRVILRGLNINGGASPRGHDGIKVIEAKSVSVSNTKIYNFARNGFNFQPTNSNAKATLNNVRIEHNAGNGVLVAPPAGVTNASVNIRYSTLVGNGCGLVATNHLAAEAAFDVNCGTLSGVGGSGKINAFNNSVLDHDTVAGATGSTGVLTNGQLSVVRIGANDITGNVHGLRTIDVGMGGIYSFVNNHIAGNNTNGTPTGTIAPT